MDSAGAAVRPHVPALNFPTSEGSVAASGTSDQRVRLGNNGTIPINSGPLPSSDERSFATPHTPPRTVASGEGLGRGGAKEGAGVGGTVTLRGSPRLGTQQANGTPRNAWQSARAVPPHGEAASGNTTARSHGNAGNTTARTNASSNHHHKSNHTRSKKSKKNSSFFVRVARSIYTLRYPLIFVGAAYGGAPLHRLCLEYAHYYTYREHSDLTSPNPSTPRDSSTSTYNNNSMTNKTTSTSGEVPPRSRLEHWAADARGDIASPIASTIGAVMRALGIPTLGDLRARQQVHSSLSSAGRGSGHSHGKGRSEVNADGGDGADSEVISAVPIAVIVPLVAVVAILAARYVLVKPLTPPPPPLPPLQPTYPPTDDDEMGDGASQFYRPRATFGSGGSFHESRNGHSPRGGGGEDGREEGRPGGDGQRGHRSAFNKEDAPRNDSSHRGSDNVDSGSGVGTDTSKSPQDAAQLGDYSHNNRTAADDHAGGLQKRSAGISNETPDTFVPSAPVTPNPVTTVPGGDATRTREEEGVDDAISTELGSAPSNETNSDASNNKKADDDNNVDIVAANGGDGDEPREVQNQTTVEVSVSRGTGCDSDPSDGLGDQGIHVGEGDYPITLAGTAQSDSNTEWRVEEVERENVPQTAAITGDTAGVSVSSLSTSSVPLPSPSSLALQQQQQQPSPPSPQSTGRQVVLVPSSRRSSVGFEAVEKALRLNSARNRQPSMGSMLEKEEALHEVGNASSDAPSAASENMTGSRSISPPPANTERRIDWDICGPSIERDGSVGAEKEENNNGNKDNGTTVATTTFTTENRHDLSSDREASPMRTALMSVLHRRRLREPDEVHEKTEVAKPTSAGVDNEVTDPSGPTVVPANTQALLKAIRLNSLSNRTNTTGAVVDKTEPNNNSEPLLLRDSSSLGEASPLGGGQGDASPSLRRHVASENEATNTDDSPSEYPMNSDMSSHTAPPADDEKMTSSTTFDSVGEESRAEDEADATRTQNMAQVALMNREGGQSPSAVVNAPTDGIGAHKDAEVVEKGNTEVDGDGAASSSSEPNAGSKEAKSLTADNTSTGSPSSVSTPNKSEKGNVSSTTPETEPPAASTVQASTRMPVFTRAGAEGEGSDRLQRLKAVLSANAKKTTAGSSSGRDTPLLVETPNRAASNSSLMAASQRNVSDSPTHASSEAAEGGDASSSVGPISSNALTNTSTPSRRDAAEELLNGKRVPTDTKTLTPLSAASASAVVILALAVPSSIEDVVGLLREAKRHKVRRVVIPKTHNHFVLVRDHEEAEEEESKEKDNTNNTNNNDQNSRPHVIRVPRGVDVEEVTNVRQFCKAASSIISTVAVHRDVSAVIGLSAPNASSYPYLLAPSSGTTSSENTTSTTLLPRRGASFYRGTTKYTALQWFNHPFNGIYVFETRQVPEAGPYTVEEETPLRVTPITKALVLEPRNLAMIVSDGPLAWCDYHVYVDTTNVGPTAAAAAGGSSSSPSMGSSPLRDLRSFNFPHSCSAPQSPNSRSGRGSEEGGLIDESSLGNANEVSLPLPFFINLALYHRTVKPPRPPSDSSASIIEDAKATGGYRSPLREPRLRLM